MNTKSGIVMEIKNNIAFIMTCDGEFAKIKIDKKATPPIIGAEYSGVVFRNSFIKDSIFRYASVACLMVFMLFGGGGAYAYYKPVSTVTLNINPSIELQSNRWDKVIHVSPLNEDGKKLLQEVSLKNKAVDTALVVLLDQAKKDKYINEDYIKSNKTVTISVEGKELNFSSLENKIKKDDFSVKIDNNGITVFNKNSKTEDKVSPNKINNTIDNPNKDVDKATSQENKNNKSQQINENTPNKDVNKDASSNSHKESDPNNNKDTHVDNSNSKSNNKTKEDENKNSTNSDFKSNTGNDHNKSNDHNNTNGNSNHSKDTGKSKSDKGKK